MIIRLSLRSLTICFLPENGIEDIEVTLSKSEESNVCQNVCLDELALYTYEHMADEDLLKQDEKEQCE